MLRRLYVDNFRCLVNFDLKFGQLNLLLGENGTGKSTVFDVVRRLQEFLVAGAKTGQVFPAADLTRWQSTPLQSFELEMEGQGGLYHYELTVEHDPNRRLQRVWPERLSFDGKPLFEFIEGTAHLYHDDFEKGPDYPFDWSQSGVASLLPRDDNKLLTWFKQRIAGIIVAKLLVPSMSSESGEEESRLSYDGTNFASWYRYISQEHQSNIIELIQSLRNTIPGFHSLRLQQAGDRRILQAGFVGKDKNEPIYYRFSDLSDGQKALIVLYSLLHGTNGAGCSLFLDEPENFLALSEIQPWLVSLSDACGAGMMQTALISHHPELIDYLGSSCGLWFERNANGPVRIRDKALSGGSGLRLSESVARGWAQ